MVIINHTKTKKFIIHASSDSGDDDIPPLPPPPSTSANSIGQNQGSSLSLIIHASSDGSDNDIPPLSLSWLRLPSPSNVYEGGKQRFFVLLQPFCLFPRNLFKNCAIDE